MIERINLRGFALFTEKRIDGMVPEVRWKHPGQDFEEAWSTKAVAVTVKSTHDWNPISTPRPRSMPEGFSVIFWQPACAFGRTSLPGRFTDTAVTGAREATLWALIEVPK